VWHSSGSCPAESYSGSLLNPLASTVYVPVGHVEHYSTVSVGYLLSYEAMIRGLKDCHLIPWEAGIRLRELLEERLRHHLQRYSPSRSVNQGCAAVGARQHRGSSNERKEMTRNWAHVNLSSPLSERTMDNIPFSAASSSTTSSLPKGYRV